MLPPSASDAASRTTIGFLRLAVLVCLAGGASLTFRSADLLPDKPLTEDGYYSLSVSRHLAAGNGPTVDGTNETNGFQPLFTFLAAAAYLVTGGERLESLRVLFLLHLVVAAATAVLLGRLVEGSIRAVRPESARLAFWLTAALYLGAAQVLAQHYNGLETGFALLLYVVVWTRYRSHGAGDFRSAVILGGLLGLLVLARIDAVILVVAVVLSRLLPAGRLSRRLAGAAAIGVTAFVVSAPWWTWNMVRFSSLMPSSGASQTEWALCAERSIAAVTAVGADLFPFVWLGALETSAAVVSVRAAIALAGSAALVVLLRRARRRGCHADAFLARTVRFSGLILAACAALALWYWASSVAIWFYARYLAPLLLVSVAGTACFLMSRDRFRGGVLRVVAVLVVLMAAATTGIYQTGRGLGGNPMYRHQLPLVRKNVPEGEVVAALQTGTLGYFREAVLNLDGKVNDQALAYRNRLLEYLDLSDVDWFCDSIPAVKYVLGPVPEENGFSLVSEDGEFALYARSGVVRAR